MAPANAMKKSLKSQYPATKTAQYSRVIHSMLTDMTFTLRGIDLCTMKLVI